MLKIEHLSIVRLIKRYKNELEDYGVIGFEIHKPPKGSQGGRPRKVYRLNEHQATLLITYLDNTEPVRQFKKALVKTFFELRAEVDDMRLQRELEKPLRRELTDCIKDWPHFSKWSYKNITDLMLRTVTGQDAKQLKKSHQSKQSALDLLTSKQLDRYQKLEGQVISLLELGLDYQQIKEILENQIGLAYISQH